jgi:small-conductance mechanosensitive channel
MNIKNLIFENLTLNKVVLSIFLVIFILMIRLAVARALNNAAKMPIERRRRYFVNLNSVISFLILFSVFLIWNDEIRSLALSLAAILVAFIIASKEFILNFMGGIFKLTQKSFHLGDRIEIEGIRGDVIDRSLFSTTILEIGPGHETHQLTGRSINIPNSIFLTKSLTNESYLKNYVLHTFKIPLKTNSNWQEREVLLIGICEDHCGDYFEEAQKHFDKIQKNSHLEVPILKPRIHINFVGPDQIDLIVRITAPAAKKGRIEQRILKDYLKRVQTDYMITDD